MKIDQLIQSREIIFLYDTQSNILDVSPAVFPILGYNSVDILNKNFSGFLHPEDNEIFLIDNILTQSTEASEIVGKYRIRSIENKYVWFESVFSVIRNDKNIIKGTIANSFVIPENKLKESFYKSIKRKYEFLANHSPDIVSVHEMDGTIVYISPLIEKYGYQSSELIGKSGFGTMHPEDIEMVKNGPHALNLKGLSSIVEWRSEKKDGTYIWFETHSSVIIDYSGAPYQILCTSRDITERKATEIQIKRKPKKISGLI